MVKFGSMPQWLSLGWMIASFDGLFNLDLGVPGLTCGLRGVHGSALFKAMGSTGLC